MTWYTELKFDENPLDIRPNPNLVGLDEEREQLINHIQKEEICFLNGLTGSGKTSLLQKTQKQLKNYSFIYLDAQDLPPNFNLEEELKKKRNFFDRISFRRYPRKKPILIIDEFQATDPRLILEARSKWENPVEKKIKGIIIAQISKFLRNVSGSFKERLGHRTITLRTLDEDEMKEILKKRLYNKGTKINYVNRLSKDAVNLLVKCADGNPRRLLEYADMVFDFHHRRFRKNNPIIKGKDYVVSYYAIREILEVNNVKIKKSAKEERKVEMFTFDKLFPKEEQKILRFLLNRGVATSADVAKRFKINPDAARRKISPLKNKGVIIVVGKKERKELLDIAENTKRLMVKK